MQIPETLIADDDARHCGKCRLNADVGFSAESDPNRTLDGEVRSLSR
jgi:hypothetical protein